MNVTCEHGRPPLDCSACAITWQAYFLAYAVASGRAPVAQKEHDALTWPDDRMRGFRTWIDARWAEWRAANRIPLWQSLSAQQFAAFGTWLRVRAVDASESAGAA